MSFEKDTAPLERVRPPSGGFFDRKRIALLAVAVAAIAGLAAWGFSLRGDDTEEIKVSDVQAANINVAEARPHDIASSGESKPAESTGQAAEGAPKAAGPMTRKGPPEGFRKVSPVIMRGQSGSEPARPASHQEISRTGAGGYSGREGPAVDPIAESGYGGQRGGSGRSSKESFYAEGGNAYVGDLDIAGDLLPEAKGCVVKAGTQIALQTRFQVRTTLPQKILGYVVNPIEGNHYLGAGEVERCVAIPAGSTILSEVNTSGVERGDLRIQACALRLDLLGGGRRVLGCQPAHGADGGAGIEASSDYEVSGIITGILIESALSSARGLGGLIAGAPGVAVQVGTGMISDVGSEYVRRELMRPPVLTMNAGAVYGVQLNGDLALPLH
ncbi:type IV secretory pathway VirB10-like protein [Skermanella aerolata]|uniref:TrbI/VirB10 family protein n=1 Tax=Skermanella aerolata TaxID=393310 RepID=UPI003D1BB510